MPTRSELWQSLDEDTDIQLHWPKHRSLLKLRGFLLDTVRDAKDFYACSADGHIPDFFLQRHAADDDDALCPDAGLPDHLFRGTRACDGLKVVIKAVHLQSHEFSVIQFLSMPPLRDDPMNHCIPVLDLIQLHEEKIAFIVMEQWSSQLIGDDIPCTLGHFLAAIRQCIEHVVFMHSHGVAHLDISLRNLLTDYEGHYAYIDFEMSRRFDGSSPVSISNFRTTEIPPECENGECPDPFKADVWALAVLILRACKLVGWCIPQLNHLVRLMLNPEHENRPSIHQVLRSFDAIVPTIPDQDLRPF
ncbi:kinase-like domain-containing protein [Roridomyces roridus]|uniref:Kinase-like domain-containing protein n=1 Tax=Roridomyces roridus TaxID=1738132 RepID=A0AAD7BWV5_9AGAR|nr:kinase-like domain-containing protein [Roridomyces roridus]